MPFRLLHPPLASGIAWQRFIAFQARRIAPSGMFCAAALKVFCKASFNAYIPDVGSLSPTKSPPLLDCMLPESSSVRITFGAGCRVADPAGYCASGSCAAGAICGTPMAPISRLSKVRAVLSLLAMAAPFSS